jgi:hypothetical protein
MEKIFYLPKYYQVFINEENGKVRILSNSKHKKGGELTQYKNNNGYLTVKLNNKRRSIHSIVSHFYLGEKISELCVNHIDGNKLNNAPNNLEYITFSENVKHSVRIGLHICNTPKLLPTYKDGRCKDKVKYKRDWYLQNRERILSKLKEKYINQKLLNVN